MGMNPFRKFLQENSIRRKLMLRLSYMVLTVFLLLVVSQFADVKSRYESELRAKQEVTTRFAALTFSNSLWNYNEVGIQEIAEALMVDPEIGSVSLRTLEGAPVYDRQSEGTAYAPEHMSRREAEVVHNGRPIGIVTIGVTRWFRQEALQREVVRSLIYLIVLTGSMAFASARVARKVIEPIHALEEGTEALANGNLDRRITVRSGDELERLADKFNVMADNLSRLIQEKALMTERLQEANEALALSENKYSQVFKNLTEAVGLLNLEDHTFAELNDTFFSVLGFTREEVLGHTSLDFTLWDSLEDRRRYLDLLTTEGSVRGFESRWRTKTGELKTGLLSSEVVLIGTRLMSVFVWSDMTEQIRDRDELQAIRSQLELKVEERTSELMALNQELMAMNDQLVSALDHLKKTQLQLLHSEKMAALGSLVAGISHEISTPIGIGVTSVSYLGREIRQLSAQLREGTLKRSALEDFLTEGESLVQTTSKNLERADLLIRSFKQISTDQTSEDLRRFKAKTYLEELMLSLNPLLRNTPHSVQIECPEDLELAGYPGSIAQILTNFITNSLRHGLNPEVPGTMRIRMDRFGDLYTLTYSDDGVGMTPEVLERIYDPFFTTKRGSEGGTGLGLHLVYNIVTQKLGGEIKCFSEPGKGVTFIITFPDIFSP